MAKGIFLWEARTRSERCLIHWKAYLAILPCNILNLQVYSVGLTFSRF